MGSFISKSVRLRGTIQLEGPVDRVFELFSPVGETHWVPGWDPELLHPPGVEWASGLIFRTREEKGDAIWVVTRLDRSSHQVEYHRVEPDRYVARVAVGCSAGDRETTAATVEYEFVGLSTSGNDEIAAMDDTAYAAKMTRWTAWINAYLHRARTT